MILGLLCYLLVAMGMGIWLEELEDVPEIPHWGILAIAMCWPFVICAMLLLMMMDAVRLLLGVKP